MASTAAYINPQAIRSYDLRGVVGYQIDCSDARQLGLAYASWVRARGLRRIAVGRDGRLSSPDLERALIAGLVAGGMLAHRIGLGPTPQLHFAVHAYGLDGGIITIRCEAADESGLERLRQVVGGHLRACGQEWDNKGS